MLVAILATLQMPWTVALPPNGAALDVLRPKLEGGGTSLTSTAIYFSVRTPIAGNSLIRLELPLAHFSSGGGASSTALGNPYIGIESRDTTTGVTIEGGARIPIGSEGEPASALGALTDVTRIEAFISNVATLGARARYRYVAPRGAGFSFDAALGPTIWFPTEGGDPELVVQHHMMAGYRSSAYWLAAGFGGITLATAEGGSLADRTFHQLGASVGLARGSARPAFHVLLPLEENFSGGVEIVIGLGLAFTLN